MEWCLRSGIQSAWLLSAGALSRKSMTLLA